jgi:hypothetical protein
MTRNKKTFIGSVLIIAVLIGAYQGVKAYQKSKIPAAVTTPEIINLSSFDSAKINKIELLGPDIRLEKKDEVWELASGGGPVDQDEINRRLWSLANLRADRIIEEAPESLAPYGLDNPAAHVIVTTEDDERVEFFGGNGTPSKAGYYVMVNGDPAVYLVAAYSGSALYLTLTDVRDKSLFPPFEFAEVERFIRESDNSRLEITLKGDEPVHVSPFSTHIMTAPYAMPWGVDPEKFNALLEPLQSLRILEFVDKAPASLAPYGLDKPVKVLLQTQNAGIELLVGKKAETGRYAKRSGDSEVFIIGEIGTVLETKAFDLLNKFALILNIDLVDYFTVRGKDPILTGVIKRLREDEALYYLNDKEVTEKSFKALYQAAIGLLMDAEHPNRPVKPGREEITIEYTLNEPENTKAVIKLIPYNRDFYALDAGGVVEFLISRSQVNQLYETAEKADYNIER